MKLFKFALISTLLSTFFIACNKDDASPATQPQNSAIEGTFDGKYGFGSDAPDYNYTLKFTSAGVVQEIGQQSGTPTGQGTYTLTGNHLTAKYKMLSAPYSDYYLDATFDANSKTLTGTWGYENASDGGKLTLQKQ